MPPKRTSPTAPANKPALVTLLIDYVASGEVRTNEPITYGDLIHLLETGNRSEGPKPK